MIHAQRQPRSLADRAGAALPREKGLVVRNRYAIPMLEPAGARGLRTLWFRGAGSSVLPLARNDFVPVRPVMGAHARATLLLVRVIKRTRVRPQVFPVFRVFRVALLFLLVPRSHCFAAPCSQRLVRLAAPGGRLRAHDGIARRHAGDAAGPSGRSERERDGRKTESDQVDWPTAARGRDKAHRRPARDAPAADCRSDPVVART
jgi:hypothetical protein